MIRASVDCLNYYTSYNLPQRLLDHVVPRNAGYFLVQGGGLRTPCFLGNDHHSENMYKIFPRQFLR